MDDGNDDNDVTMRRIAGIPFHISVRTFKIISLETVCNL